MASASPGCLPMGMPSAGNAPPDIGYLAASACRPALNTDRWFYGVFQSAPDLIRWLAGPDDRSLADQPVPTDLDCQYRFLAPELKAGSHRLDGVLWPLTSDAGTPELPVVLLEVQMRADPGFLHRGGVMPSLLPDR